MELFGINFAPLRVPLERRLQTLAVGAWFLIAAFGGMIGSLLTLYMLFTRFWWLSSLYLLWIYIDRKTCENGGRPSLRVHKWAWWYYMKHYFPSRLSLSPNFHLDRKKNYLFCCFPHGVLPIGPYTNIHSYYSEFQEKYPDFRIYSVLLTIQFMMPFARELAYGVGCISCSAKSINSILGRPEGSNIALLMPGGAVEAYNSRPGQYKIVVKKRKGFVRLALKNGSPLVPVLSFGECELFDQIEGPRLRKVQEFIRKWVGLAPVVFNGRGFFQYTFGLIPRRRPITTVVGAPIDVPKIRDPSEEEVGKLHEKFMKELSNLFEKHKHEYLQDAEDKHLIFE